jgi:hypothetical protein
VERPYIWGDSPAATGKVRHPRMERNQLFEYKKLLRPGQQGVPYFKKSFGLDDYCNNEPAPDRKKYIDHLIRAAAEEGKIPLLQFNRTALRVRWFKTNYPGSLNMYLARNPRDQWQSYISLREEQSLDIFLIMDLMIAGKNKNTSYFKTLSRYIYLPSFTAADFRHEEQAYRSLLGAYTYEESYFIFYFTWFTALWENVIHSDILLTIDLLGSDKAYTRKITAAIAGKGIEGIDFSETDPRRCREYKLDIKKMAHIEGMVQALVSEDRGNLERDRFLSKLSKTEQELFNISEKSLTPRGNLNLQPLSKKEIIKKHEDIIDTLLQLNNSLTEKNRELFLTKQTLQRIKNSNSYKIGKLLLSPIRQLRKLLERR